MCVKALKNLSNKVLHIPRKLTVYVYVYISYRK